LTPEEREKMEELCKKIETENNPEIFERLVAELESLVDAKRHRINPQQKP
jgi:hypothetical protein